VGLGGACAPFPENFGTFSLEMAHFGSNSVVYLTEMLGLLLLGPQELHVYMYCWRMCSIETVEPPSLRPWYRYAGNRARQLRYVTGPGFRCLLQILSTFGDMYMWRQSLLCGRSSCMEQSTNSSS